MTSRIDRPGQTRAGRCRCPRHGGGSPLQRADVVFVHHALPRHRPRAWRAGARSAALIAIIEFEKPLAISHRHEQCAVDGRGSRSLARASGRSRPKSRDERRLGYLSPLPPRTRRRAALPGAVARSRSSSSAGVSARLGLGRVEPRGAATASAMVMRTAARRFKRRRIRTLSNWTTSHAMCSASPRLNAIKSSYVA
jgi:hypothetical protein